ncbi:MAG: hypothetical protein M3422_27710 [Actinomycetota bacterium]|nr:hypothetical protein [Actinomycetota bacterium]
MGEGLREHGRHQQALEIRTRSGRRLTYLPGTDIEDRYDAPFYALHRAELHHVLARQLDPDTLHTGHRATTITTDADTATVIFQTTAGTVSETADLVVAADGVNSHLRRHRRTGHRRRPARLRRGPPSTRGTTGPLLRPTRHHPADVQPRRHSHPRHVRPRHPGTLDHARRGRSLRMGTIPSCRRMIRVDHPAGQSLRAMPTECGAVSAKPYLV